MPLNRVIVIILFLMVTGSPVLFLHDPIPVEKNLTSSTSVKTELSPPKHFVPRAVIVIDPGHGGAEEGAKGWATKVKEKEITLSIAKAAQDWLSRHGVKVFLTRISDYQLAGDLKKDLQLRAKFADLPHIQASLFVSIHIDQYNRKIHGTKVYYSKQNPFPEPSKQLAGAIHDAVVKEIHSTPLKVHHNNFLVLKENVKPAVLIEVGHLSHPGEEQKLIQPEYQKQAGIGIAKGILSYLNLKSE